MTAGGLRRMDMAANEALELWAELDRVATAGKLEPLLAASGGKKAEGRSSAKRDVACLDQRLY
jgi:hypothetical protein